MDMLMEGLPVLAVFLAALAIVQVVIRRVRFDSQDVLEIRGPDGRVSILKLSRLKNASAAQRAEEFRRITTELG